MPPRRPISFEIKREYNNVKPRQKGKITDIVDFHMNGRNRYMKINQPSSSLSSRANSISRNTGTSSGLSSRNKTLFKNPRLNRYDDTGEDDYDIKQYVFDYQEDESIHKKRHGRSRSRRERKKNGGLEDNQSGDSNDEKINEKKVGETVKMIEDLLKENKKAKKISGTSKQNKDKSKKKVERLKLDKNEYNGDSSNEDEDKKTKNATNPTEEEKNEYFKEKNIVVNMSVNDIEDPENITKKPLKKNLVRELSNKEIKKEENDEKRKKEKEGNKSSRSTTNGDKTNRSRNGSSDKSARSKGETGSIKSSRSKIGGNEDSTDDKEMKTSSTQTPRNLETQLREDHLQYAPDGRTYINNLVNDVEKIGKDVSKEKMEETNGEINQNENNMIESTKNEPNIKDSKKNKNKTGQKTTNSLGLTIEGKDGINMAIIKGVSSEYDSDPNLTQSARNRMRGEKNEQILLKQNYQNLEELISHLMVSDNDENYLKIAKLNRLKVLMEMSMKMVGRKYKDIGNVERNTLELQANRFHTTYPLPGEEKPLYETDDKGAKLIRHPLKICQEDGMAKIDINAKYRIDPSEFLSIYTNRLINHAQDSTGLQFDNITVTIPAAYGTQQREAIKNSVNEAADRDDIQILTRPVAAAVILNNQRNAEIPRESTQLSTTSSNLPENFKIVFDITENSMDASVIRIKDSKDFNVISNVGDTSFGLHDIDERIVEYIITEKAQIEKKTGKKLKDISAHDVETVNAYASLVRHIKQHVSEHGVVSVDLDTMNEVENTERGPSLTDLVLNKTLISKVLCKDIYDWSLAHIEKAIHQADVNDKDIDEIIIIGGQQRMPGFYEYLKEAYPKKTISFVPEDDLAVGAAIVGRKLKYQQIKITEVLCRSIGIGLYTGVITYLLFRNSSLPCVGGCVYSTLVDDQESMVLDVYEGERPHVKFCRYLGEVTILNLPKGEAGKVKCELYLKMNHEGLLEVNAKDLNSGKQLETVIDANPEHLSGEEVNSGIELDPIEAERYKKPDYDFVYQLESLDEYLEDLSEKYRTHQYSKFILDKIFDTKEWLYKNRKTITLEDCYSIRYAINKFLKGMESLA